MAEFARFVVEELFLENHSREFLGELLERRGVLDDRGDSSDGSRGLKKGRPSEVVLVYGTKGDPSDEEEDDVVRTRVKIRPNSVGETAGEDGIGRPMHSIHFSLLTEETDDSPARVISSITFCIPFESCSRRVAGTSWIWC